MAMTLSLAGPAHSQTSPQPSPNAQLPGDGAAAPLPPKFPPNQTLSVTVPRLTAVRLLIQNGDLAGARKILADELRAHPDSIEGLFLLGQVEGLEGHWDKAAEDYRRILVDHPELVRVRLELARALYELHDDETAEYHFKLAMAEPKVPDAVVDNISRYLTSIRQRKKYSFFATFGIAPDTNVNAAPAASQVTLFGLPFQLSQEATQHSGIGVVSSLNGEYFIPFSDLGEDRWRVGGSLYRAEYPGGAFDDMQARAATGPQFRFQDSDFSILGVYAQRWFGNDPYNTGWGARLEGGKQLNNRMRLDGFVEGLRLRYHSQQFLDGWSVSDVNFLSYGLDSKSFVRLITGLGTDRTQTPSYSNVNYRVGAGYVRNFEYGITANVQPEFMLYDYDSVNPFFGKTREDRIYRVLLSFYKRDFNIFGFSPTFNYTFTYDDSNIDFFAFTRHQFQIGLTREF